MSSFAGKATGASVRLATAALVFAVGGILVGGARQGHAQEAKKTAAAQAAGAGAGSAVARGQYLVEGVAMCGTCHTPRHADGTLEMSQWLAGAAVPYQPSQPTKDWPTVAPRIAGLPPATNDEMVTLLTTGIWTTGKPLRDPMPKFHMTKADAEAVVAYLKSVKTSK
jgi:mono/diheme cytochrome c family protein